MFCSNSKPFPVKGVVSVAPVFRVFLVALMALPVASKAAYTHLSYDIVTVSEWGTTYRVYAHFDAPGDIIQALYAEAPNGMAVTSTEGFHQNPSGGFLPIDIDPLSFAAIPALEFDSWLTIGQADNAMDSPIAQSFGPAWDSAMVAFENGGDFVVSDGVGGSVFATPNQPQATPDAEGRVLIAQLTTAGSWSVTVNIQWRDENLSVGNEVGETLSFSDSAVTGCMYSQACNYNELASEDDGSCEFTSCSGCTMESASNYDPSATIDDGGCVLPGCIEEWALNFNPHANVSDESCIDSNSGCLGDLNFNGLVSTSDLLLLLQNFGQTCSSIEDCEEVASCESPTLEGYTYDVVQIGDQCWFAENLRTSVYLNGDNIETNPSEGWTLTTDGAVASHVNSTTDLLYGRSYSWFAVHDGRGLCPSGWKVPSDEEWQALELTIGMDEAEVSEFGWRGAGSGTLLKSASGWSDMGNGSDAFGFGALPGGNVPSGGYDNVGARGFWWTESQDVISRHIASDESGIKKSSDAPRQGFSIRCVQLDEGCIDPDGDGICAEDEVPGCTSLFALNFNPTATENDGTCLFENCGSPELDGYNYSTVVIGDQCWFSENLRTSIYADGSSIPNVTDGVTWGALEEGARCIYNNNPGLYADLGYMYNWYAVADERSICPSGWHVPTDEEWREMGEFIGIPVDELEDYGSRGSAEQAGESLKTEFFWGDVANGGSDDHGFAGKAGGFRTHTTGGFGNLNTHGTWWSSTYAYDTPDGPEAWYTALQASDSGVIRNTVFTTIGRSIRCMQGPPPTLGCTDSAACNYAVLATDDDGSCLQFDECGECGGDGIPAGDCDCEGNQLDECGVCGGDGSSCTEGCTDPAGCNFNASATLDDCSCLYEDACGVCGGEGETCGTCIDTTLIDEFACATTFCDYVPVCGCDGNTYWNGYCAQICGGLSSWTEGPCHSTNVPCSGGCENSGCANPDACNFDPNATAEDDGYCAFYVEAGCLDLDGDGLHSTPNFACYCGPQDCPSIFWYDCEEEGCDDPDALNWNDACNGPCQYELGCTPVTFDGHTYDVVEIGDQCWFAEDLVSTHFSNGDPIASGQAGTVQVSMAAEPDCARFLLEIAGDAVPMTAVWQRPGLLEPNDFVPQCSPASADQLQAKVYNQLAIADNRNLCPSGWHVAGDADWLLLEAEMGLGASDLEVTGNRWVNVAPWQASCSWFTAGQLGITTPDDAGAEGSDFKPIMEGDFCGATDIFFDTGLYWATGEGSTLWYRRVTSSSIFRQDVSLGTLSNLATPVRCVRDE